jgi:non-ribosomal peptide synthetase component F
MQQAMLAMTLSAPAGSGYYIEQAVAAIAHPLDEELFADAWRVVFSHYEVLRTEFDWEGKAQAEQVLREDAELPVELRDLSDTPAPEQEEVLQEFLEEDRARGFSLNQAPLTRVTLLRWGDARYHCVWTLHHTLADGRAMAAVLREVFALYDARLRGDTHTLPGTPGFREYVESLAKAPPAEAERFWKDYLAGFEEAPAPPLPPPDPPPEAGISAEQLVLPAHLGDSLQALARTAGCTTGTIVQAAWALVLARYTQRDDIVYGATKEVRHSACAPSGAVGLYINTLPLRIHVDEDATVVNWLGEVRRNWLALRSYENSGYQDIRTWAGVRGGKQLYHSVLVFETGSIDRLVKSSGGDWKDRHFKLHERTPGALTIAVYAGEQLELTAEFDRTLYRAPEVARMLQHMARVLESMAAAPHAPVSEVELISREERETLLQTRQGTAFEIPSGTVVDWFVRTAEAHANRNALEHETRAMRYAELETATARLAAVLAREGVGPGVFVGLSVPRSIEGMVGLLAILRAGGAYVPIDPAYPGERLDYLCRDAGIEMMATVRALQPVWEGRVKRVFYLDEPHTWADAEQNTQLAAPRPEDPAYVIYTSGTTGKPKGVVVHHGALAAFVSGAFRAYGMREDDRMLQFSSLSFDAAIEEIFLPLCHGLTLVLRTDDMSPRPPTFTRHARHAMSPCSTCLPPSGICSHRRWSAPGRPPACAVRLSAARPCAPPSWRNGARACPKA